MTDKDKCMEQYIVVVVVVQSLSHIRLFVTPWTVAHQASLSFTNTKSLLKLMFIESVMPSNHLVLCHPLLLLPSTFPSIKVFTTGSALQIRWPKYWNVSISPSTEYSELVSLRLFATYYNTKKTLLVTVGVYWKFRKINFITSQYMGVLLILSDVGNYEFWYKK